jgi:hypothetical protein
MFFKLFSKSSEPRPRVDHNPALSDDLARRVSAIEFKPSKGFLKDRAQPKRSSIRAQRSAFES